MSRIPYPLREPWLISEQGKAQVLDVWNRAHELGLGARIAAALERTETYSNEHQAQVVGGVAVITIDGPLMRKAELFTDISGATSYQWIRARLDDAIADPSVHTILLRCNSPGGEAAGCGELADFIAASPKPIDAYVETLACSGMQWLIAGCRKVTAHPTAFLGSVGARIMVTDDAERDAKAGIKEHEIISTGSPGKRGTPVDGDVLARAQGRCDAVASPFFGAMAEWRAGGSLEKVLSDFGQGDVVPAPRAVEVGLADALGNFDSTLAALTAGASFTRPAGHRGENMNPAIHSPGSVAAPPSLEASGHPPWTCAGCKQEMGGNAKAYCAHCMDGKDDDEDEDDEEGKALAAMGLRGKTRGETRANLIAFAQGTIEAVGAKTAAAALGKVTGNASAAATLESYQKQVAEDAGKARASAFSAKLSAALTASKVTLGMACNEVPLLLGAGKAAARARIAALATQDAASVVAALTADPLTAEAAESLDEWLSAKGAAGPVLPAPHREPPPDEKNTQQIAISDADARRFGLDSKLHAHLLNVKSVADLPRPRKE